MIGHNYFNVLRVLINELSMTEVIWAIMGSTNLALQGLSIEPNDIDVQTDRSGAYEIQSRFSRYVVKRVTLSATDKIRSHIGILKIQGIKVHIAGDIQIMLHDGIWERPPELNQQRCFVEFDGMPIPVVSLEREYEMYLHLGKRDVAEMISVLLKEAHK